ncbi:MAP3K12-binding inhibitory protein 1-like [Lineus longissimus]|uniref:MAP3K12-binding inhibitory protein 1-like n=1 Tax=Lineus longissimus TaxID=88925 RepID=UPI002B4D0224
MSGQKVKNSDIASDILKILWDFFDQVKIADGLPSSEDVQIPNGMSSQALTSYVERVVKQLQDVLKTLKESQSSQTPKSHCAGRDHVEEKTEVEQKRLIDPSLVQVRADKSEIERRITAFIEKKQQEVDENNKRDFCSVFSIDTEPENSCARTDAVFMAGSEGKGHVKVSRVVNSWGPQTRMNYDLSLQDQPPNLGTDQSSATLTNAIHDRLQNMEKHLGMKVRQDNMNNISTAELFQRIKELEERILYLESLSPEYFNSIPAPKKAKKDPSPVPSSLHDGTTHIYRGLSMSEINERISSLQQSLRQKEGSD